MSTVILTFLLTMLQAQAGPPQRPAPRDCSGAAHRQFDFWIGEWDVAPHPGAASTTLQVRGTNVITSEHAGCVIVERWEGSGITGGSYNIYDRTRGEWHQTWVDSSGGLHLYRGRLVDGKMVFYGDAPTPSSAGPSGRRTLRLTYTPMGSDGMRQTAEVLMADGSWTVLYDLVYKRKK